MLGIGTNFIKFLMGLNTVHDAVKDQILAMDPISIVSRSYYMIQQEEKQKQVRGVMNAQVENEAYGVNKQLRGNQNNNRKELRKGKADQFGDYCKTKGEYYGSLFQNPWLP